MVELASKQACCGDTTNLTIHDEMPSNVVVSQGVHNFLQRFVNDEKEYRKLRSSDIKRWKELKQWKKDNDNKIGENTVDREGKNSENNIITSGDKDYEYFKNLESSLDNDAKKEDELQNLALKLAMPSRYTQELYPGLKGCSGDHTAERMIYERPEEDKISSIKECKSRGNQSFQDKDWKVACAHYQRGLIFADYSFPEDELLNKELDELVETLNLNMAQALINLEEYRTALNHTYQVLWRNPNSIKGYHRRGVALRNVGEFEEAKEAFEKGLEFDPDNESIKKQLELLSHQVSNYNSSLKETASKMVNPIIENES